ncbi:hypothetical protein pb186bvf_003734 [Paramecium bursaria]
MYVYLVFWISIIKNFFEFRSVSEFINSQLTQLMIL